ncbi:helix-turn-helix domain-containing protein [Streptomyces populi]|uniref:helix-turn-helix domain-containing protein n=1 Tax=Streptomyces populi TaxID=2058924 RepID=UPI0035DD35E3
MSSQDEIEEFAALLRHLKGRTDRSYAALARRLNMNASTLHRYCAGEAVPLGFASVEKFAAMCGASTAERVELHRLWILAVAARQRSRTTPGTGSGQDTGEAAPEAWPDAPEAPEPEAGPDAPGTPGSEPRPDAARAPESGTGPVGVGVPVRSSGPGADGTLPPPGGPDAVEALPPVTDLAPVPGAHPADGSPARAGAPRTRRFRRRAVVTSAVVTALVATLGSLSALPSGHSSKDAADRVAVTPTAKAAGARHGTATPSASPSATHGRPSGSPSPSPSGSRTTSPSPSTSPSPTSVSAGPPLTWTVNSHRWSIGCGHTYVIDKAPEQVPPPPAPQDASPWAQTQNAVHGGETLVDITVQGRSDAAVVLEALRVRVVGRSAPLKGVAYATGGGCGGGLGVGAFTVDLDKDRPVASPVSSDDGTGPRILRPPFRVSVQDPQVLMVDALTKGCDCRWYLELDWSSRGRTGTVRIDDRGAPFRTSGIEGLPYYWYANGGWTLR